jgi:hypothetical protein
MNNGCGLTLWKNTVRRTYFETGGTAGSAYNRDFQLAIWGRSNCTVCTFDSLRQLEAVNELQEIARMVFALNHRSQG